MLLYEGKVTLQLPVHRMLQTLSSPNTGLPSPVMASQSCVWRGACLHHERETVSLIPMYNAAISKGEHWLTRCKLGVKFGSLVCRQSSVKINQVSLDESGENVGICSEDGKVRPRGYRHPARGATIRGPPVSLQSCTGYCSTPTSGTLPIGITEKEPYLLIND